MREYVNVFSKAVREPPPYSSCQLGEHVWGHIGEWAIHEDLSDGSTLPMRPLSLPDVQVLSLWWVDSK